MFYKKHKVPEEDPWAEEKKIWARKRAERHEAMMKVYDQCEDRCPKSKFFDLLGKHPILLLMYNKIFLRYLK